MITALVQRPMPGLGSSMLAIAFGLVATAALADGDRASFIRKNRYAIVERLRSIHERGPQSTSKDRFLTVVPFGAPNLYVQCIFFEDDTKMYCEAASGRYGLTGDLLSAPSSDAIAALTALGFTMDDPKGNFAREIEIGTLPDLDPVADLMLGALHDGYGIRSGDALDFCAPMARPLLAACPEPAR